MPSRPAETRLLVAAAAVGLIHAAFSLYWAFGGRWLLPTVGEWAVELAEEAPVWSAALLVAVAVLKITVAVAPVAAGSGVVRLPPVWRRLAWVAAVVLVGYGAVNSVVGWLVLGGVLNPDGGDDRDAMIGHAFLWDPLFLVWGLLLGAGLMVGRRTTRMRR